MFETFFKATKDNVYFVKIKNEHGNVHSNYFLINKRARTVFKNIFNRTFRVHDPSSAIKFICKYKADNNNTK